MPAIAYIARLAELEDIEAPATLIVGDVVAAMLAAAAATAGRVEAI